VTADVVAICLPAADLSFAERVRALLHTDTWDLGSAEGVALMQALLGGSYPQAMVSRNDRGRLGDGQRVVLEVHRDGSDTAVDPAATMLSAIHDRQIAMAYGAAVRVLGDTTAVEATIDRAFLLIAACLLPTSPIDALLPAIRDLSCRMALGIVLDHAPALAIVAAPTAQVGGTRRTTVTSALEAWRVAERAMAVGHPLGAELRSSEDDVERSRAAYQLAVADPGRPR